MKIFIGKIFHLKILQAKMKSAVSRAMENLLKPLYQILDDEMMDAGSAETSSSDGIEASEEELQLMEELDDITRDLRKVKIPDYIIRGIVGDDEITLTEQAETPVKMPEVRRSVRRSERERKERLPQVLVSHWSIWSNTVLSLVNMI